MEEENNVIVKWAQEDVETSYNLVNKINIDVLICGHDTEHIYNDIYTGTRNVILAKHRL